MFICGFKFRPPEYPLTLISPAASSKFYTTHYSQGLYMPFRTPGGSEAGLLMGLSKMLCIKIEKRNFMNAENQIETASSEQRADSINAALPDSTCNLQPATCSASDPSGAPRSDAPTSAPHTTPLLYSSDASPAPPFQHAQAHRTGVFHT